MSMMLTGIFARAMPLNIDSRFFVLTATAYNLVRIPKLSRQRDECVWSDENEAKIRELGAIGADTLVYPHVPDLQTLKELSKKHVFSAAC
jgi:hypothetical protein